MATIAERINARTTTGPISLRRGAPGNCLIWTGARTHDGYGRIYDGGRTPYVHRVAYELAIAPIPDGLQIDHRCRVRNCINPAHLEPVTGAVNVQRSSIREAARARSERTTHCPQGHPYDDANTYRGARGRKCRACQRDSYRERYATDPEFRERQQAASRDRMRVRRTNTPERTAA